MKNVKRQQWLVWVAAGMLVGMGGVGWGEEAKPPVINPQIVRLSYVEGDVRLSRGAEGEKATGAEWETAAADVPLYAGFTLVTGANGRAVVEFEDASRAYLGENSVLSFGDLSAMTNSRHTELDLVSGVMTLEALTPEPGGVITVKTPANSFWLKSPSRVFMRVNSYLDGMELTPMLGDTKINSAAGATNSKVGQKMVFQAGQSAPKPAPPGPNEYAAWDAWVLEQSLAHNEAMSAAMKEAGLSAPVPGLTEIAAEGSFFDCAPYGKCWAPKDGWEGGGDPAGEPAAEPAAANAKATAPVQTASAANVTSVAQPCSSVVRSNCVVQDDFFPCSPLALRSFYDRDPLTHKLRLVFSEQSIGTIGYRGRYPYLWGVCHVGSWVRWHRRYVWVAGPHRHHHWGVRWVKVGGKVGYVPVHPRDVAGKPPLNIKHGVYVDAGKKEHGSELLHVSDPVKLLDGTPKEYAKENFVELPRAAAPHMEARQMHEANTAHHGDAIAMSRGVLTLDHKTGSFQIARTVNDGGHEHVVVQPVGGRGGMAMSRDSTNSFGASNNSGASNAYRGGAQQTGWNNSGASQSRSYSAPSEGAHYSAPVSSAPSAPSAPISAPSGPSGGAHH